MYQATSVELQNLPSVKHHAMKVYNRYIIISDQGSSCLDCLGLELTCPLFSKAPLIAFLVELILRPGLSHS
jgi:hypothetical protein